MKGIYLKRGIYGEFVRELKTVAPHVAGKSVRSVQDTTVHRSRAGELGSVELKDHGKAKAAMILSNPN